MTDPDVEERRVMVKFEKADNREVQIECLKVSWSESDDFEERLISVNFNETSESAEKYNTHQKYRRPNMRKRYLYSLKHNLIYYGSNT